MILRGLGQSNGVDIAQAHDLSQRVPLDVPTVGSTDGADDADREHAQLGVPENLPQARRTDDRHTRGGG